MKIDTAIALPKRNDKKTLSKPYCAISPEKVIGLNTKNFVSPPLVLIALTGNTLLQISKKMNLGIRAKLLATFGALTALLAVVGFVGWRNTVELGKDAENLYTYQVKGTVALANSESALWKLRFGLAQFIVLPEKRSEILAEESQLYKIIDDNLGEYATGEITPEEQAAFEKVQDGYHRYIAARPRWFELQQAGKLQEAAEYRAATTTRFGAETVQAFSALIELQRKVGETKHHEIEAKIERLTVFLVLTLIFALLSAAALTAIISRDIVNSIVQSLILPTDESGGFLNESENSRKALSKHL